MERNGLSVGFDRTNITPDVSNHDIPLRGFGASHLRLATRVLHPLYVNTVALGRGDSAELLLLTLDLGGVQQKESEAFRDRIAAETGVARERILIGATHTHSAPDLSCDMESVKRYNTFLMDCVAASALRAIADRKPAKLRYGSMTVGHEGAWLNFERHYKMVPIEKADSWTEDDLADLSVNFTGDLTKWKILRHDTDVDHEMQILRFDREGAKNVTIIGFQAHPVLTGHRLTPEKKRRTNISSDFPGVTCTFAEELLPDTWCVFYQGAAGNCYPVTKIPEEGVAGLTYDVWDAEPYSAALAEYVRKICTDGLRDSSTDELGFLKEFKTCSCKHDEDFRVPEAQIVNDAFNKAGAMTEEINALCRRYGFSSPYHAIAVLSKARLPLREELELNAVRIGDVGLVTSTCELYSAIQEEIKRRSPFAMTMVKAYSCGSNGYIVAEGAPKCGYEYSTMRYPVGVGEEMAEQYVGMLEKLANNSKKTRPDV